MRKSLVKKVVLGVKRSAEEIKIRRQIKALEAKTFDHNYMKSNFFNNNGESWSPVMWAQMTLEVGTDEDKEAVKEWIRLNKGYYRRTLKIAELYCMLNSLGFKYNVCM